MILLRHTKTKPNDHIQSTRHLCFTTSLISIVFFLFTNVTVAKEQVIALPDSQSVFVTFPDTTYHYPTPEGCEGSKCACNYGKWTLLKSLTVFKSFGDTSRFIGQLSQGDSIVAQKGWLYVDRPGVVVVTDTMKYGWKKWTYKTVNPGDTLFVMQPTCETHFIVWYKDQFIDIEAKWSGADDFGTSRPRAHQIIKPKRSWWIKITTPTIKEGFLRITENNVFDGPDKCCPKFR